MVTKTEVRILIYIFALIFTSVSSCDEQPNCYSRRNMICGFCVRNKSEKTGKCIFPFNIFEEGARCILKKHCEDNCNDQGQCVEVDESYSCLCDVGFYGSSCKHKTPRYLHGIVPRQTGFEVFTVVKFHAYKFLPFWYSCDSNDVSSEFDIKVLTPMSNGYYENRRFSRSGCVEWTPTNNKRIYIQLRVRFPFIRLGNYSDSEILLFGNEVLGYLTTYEIQYKVKAVTFSHRRKIFVSYNQNMRCAPVINLINCSPSKHMMVTFTRSRLITVTNSLKIIAEGALATFHYDSFCPHVKILYHWRLWLNSDYDEIYSTIDVWDEEELHFDPFSLMEGTYRVLLEVGIDSRWNFAYCYFRVQLEPLIVVLEGGSERTIVRENGLVLDARRSKDPNQRHDNQTFLYATWNCVQVQDVQQRDICENKTLPVSEVYKVSPDKLVSEGDYKITLTIWSNIYDLKAVPPVIAGATVRVAQEFIRIECLLNCEGTVITSESLVLKAKSSIMNAIYSWTYYEQENSKGNNITLIADYVDEITKSILEVRKYALHKGKHYTIQAKSSSSDNIATYSFETEREVEPNEFNCSVNPTFGVRGISLFDIICENFNGLKQSLIFEFYDKYSEEAELGFVFSGRMLGTSYTGKLKSVRLTRGSVFVYVLSEKALQTYKRFNIELSPVDVNKKVLNEMFNILTQKVQNTPVEESMRYLSVIADLIPTSLDKSDILDYLLHFITGLPANSLPNIKLRTSTLYAVLSLNAPQQLVIEEPELLKDVLKIIYEQTALFRETIGAAESLQGMTPSEIREVAKYQLNSMLTVLSCRDPQTEGVSELDYDVKNLYALMQASNYIEDTVYLVQDILTFLQAPGQPPFELKSQKNSTFIWAMKNDDDYNLTNHLNGQIHKRIPISICNKSLSSFERAASASKGHFTLRVATVEDNIFWWRSSDVKSNFIFVSPVKQLQGTNVRKLTEGNITLSINLNPTINSTKVSGTALKLDIKNETFDLSGTFTIHRLDPALNSILTLKFFFPETNGSLRVFVSSQRPSYDVLKSNKSQIIKEGQPNYNFGTSNMFHQRTERFLYVGILCSEVNHDVSYTFEINTTVCQNWVRGQWSSLGCKTTNKHDLDVSCECQHFSVFAAAFPVPPQEINPFTDYKLFLTIPDNPLVVAFVSAVLLLYIFLCIWAKFRDNVDRKSRYVNVLEDNFPGDHYPYLLAVYTSSRFNAGTTANVGIKLIGKNFESRAHVLTSKFHKVLKRNHDDWFLIFCPQHLGLLQNIHVWHDNTGSSPDWFLTKILVYDLTKSIEVIFIVEDWLALQSNEYPEATITPATVVQVRNVKRMFVENFALGLRESHSFLSIFLRHPRSEISRLQRISVFMCLFMVAMLCSIMFYSSNTGGEGVDESHYDVGMREVYVAIQGIVITLIFTSLVLVAFKRSYKYPFVDIKAKKNTYYGKNVYSFDSVSSTTLRPSNSSRAACVRFFLKTIRERPLIPAQLSNSQSLVVVRRNWLVIAWFLCITIILVSSFLLVLYGLKLGKVKSKKWLTLVFLMVGEDVFFIGPAKVIAFAVVLSIVFHKLYDEETHGVTLNDARAIVIPDDERYLEKLLTVRSHLIYVPISNEVKEEMMRRKILKDNWWTLIDFSLAVGFVGVVSALVFRLWSSYYYFNSHISYFMAGSHLTSLGQSQQFFSIKYLEQSERYLRDSFIMSLYNNFWYNKMPLESREAYYSEDFVNKIVGLQLLRQFRVTPTKCELKFLNTSKKCIPHLSADSEEVDVFSIKWSEGDHRDRSREDWPWKYTEKTTPRWSTMYRLYGASGALYRDGGYLTLLGPKTDNVQKTMLELIGNKWQDVLTRVVFVEFTLYNANVDLISQVTMIVEYLLAGTIQLKIKVTSTETRMKWELWNGLFVVFIFYYAIRSATRINRLGLIEFLKLSRYRTQLVVVVLGTLCVAGAVVHDVKSTSYYEEFIDEGKLKYFDFDIFIFYFLILQALLSTLLAIAMFRTISLLRGGRRLLNNLYTLYIATNCLIWLVLVTALFLMVQFFFFKLLNIFSMTNIQEMLIDPKSFKYLELEDMNKQHVRILFFVKLVSVSIISGLFVVIFMHHTKTAKIYKIKSSDKFNFLTFLFKNFKCIRNKS